MSRFLAGAALGVVIAGILWLIVSRTSGSHNVRVGGQEWAVLAIGYDNGICKMTQKAPNPLRTASGRVVHWVIQGECPAGHTLAIDRNFSHNGQKTDILQPGSLQAPAKSGGAPITGTLKNGVDSGDYTYTVLIDGKPAEYASLADDGDMYVCPVWPC